PTAQNVLAVRRALADWGVTMIVYADPSVLPRYDQGTAPESALGLLTLAVGRTPRFVDDAWVWSDVESLSDRLATSTQSFKLCTSGFELDHAIGQTVLGCVVASAHRVR
ncbi:MAG: hypothetical protein WAM97_00500, partial [Acidimicrobiales bacterium]